MATFFTADTHFGHASARGFYRRPFPSIEATDAAMLDRWNAVVTPNDDVWHLGDVAIGPSPSQIDALLHQLHGRKHLITGNNDGPSTSTLPSWASVQPYAEIEADGVSLVLCHYPFRTWRNMARGSWNLHGHSHGRLKPLPRQADVGVDAKNFQPVTLTQIIVARRSKAPSIPPANPR